MSTLLQKLRRRLLGVSPARATFFSRGDSALWRQLENAALTELQGYHLALEASRFAALIPRLDALPLEMRSYAYEGAAMALTGLEVLLPWRKRLDAYLAGPGSPISIWRISAWVRRWPCCTGTLSHTWPGWKIPSIAGWSSRAMASTKACSTGGAPLP